MDQQNGETKTGSTLPFWNFWSIWTSHIGYAKSFKISNVHCIRTSRHNLSLDIAGGENMAGIVPPYLGQMWRCPANTKKVSFSGLGATDPSTFQVQLDHLGPASGPAWSSRPPGALPNNWSSSLMTRLGTQHPEQRFLSLISTAPKTTTAFSKVPLITDVCSHDCQLRFTKKRGLGTFVWLCSVGNFCFNDKSTVLVSSSACKGNRWGEQKLHTRYPKRYRWILCHLKIFPSVINLYKDCLGFQDSSSGVTKVMTPYEIHGSIGLDSKFNP